MRFLLSLLASRWNTLFLVGATTYVCYKLLVANRRTMKRWASVVRRYLGWSDAPFVDPVFFDNSRRVVSFNWKLNAAQAPSDVPDLNFPFPKTPLSSPGDDVFFSLPAMMPLSSTTNVTVELIDEVLEEINDIKRSMVDLDSQMYKVSGVANFNPDFFTLTNGELEGSEEVADAVTAAGPDEAKHFHALSEEPRTPQETSLEWDDQWNHFDSNNDVLNWSPADGDHFKADRSPSLITLNGPDEEAENRLNSMDELLDEAKKLGLLNDILEVLSKNCHNNNYVSKQQTAESYIIRSNRDSAYFEE